MRAKSRTSATGAMNVLLFTLSLLIYPIPSAPAAVTLPTDAFQACTSTSLVFCVEKVSVQNVGESEISLRWIPSGTPGPALETTNGAVAGRDLPGRWTAEGAFRGESYDGLYLDVKQANPFVPWIFADVRPTISASGTTKSANNPSAPNYPIDLNSDVLITFMLRAGNFEPGVTFGVGTDGSVRFAPNVGFNDLVFSGYPVRVPLAKASKDCSGDAGVAAARVSQLNTIFVPKNDDRGFGIEGSTGRLYIGSNGICKLSTPSWIASSKTFSYKASGPRLAPDGKEVNTGFYHASIPFEDAKALWGLDKPQDAASALVVSVRTNAGGTSGATKLVTVKNQQILIRVSGFEFPDPSVDVSLNPEYNSKGAPTGDNNTLGGVTDSNNTLGGVTGKNNMSLAGGGATKSKTTTITCVKGNKTQKVKGVNPKCPKGYKKK